MKKNIIVIALGAVVLTGSLLSSCTGNKNTNEVESKDTVKNALQSVPNDSIVQGEECKGSEMEGLNISELPQTAKLQSKQGDYELYVNVEQAPNEDDITGVYSVWLADRSKNIVRRIVLTNPSATPVWEEMSAKNGGVVVPMHEIAAAERAMFASKDCKRIVVEGCPDARNIWTYIIDLDTRTVMQLTRVRLSLPRMATMRRVDVTRIRRPTHLTASSYVRPATPNPNKRHPALPSKRSSTDPHCGPALNQDDWW